MTEVATLPLQKNPINGQFVPGHCLASKNAYYHDPQVLQDAVDEYFTICEEKDHSPVVTGLALFLGFAGRQSLFNYTTMPGRTPYKDIIKRAKSKIEAHRVQRMVDGRGNVVGAIFDLKNNFGYIDKQVSESHTRVEQVIAPEDREALKDLALKMIEAQEDEALLIEPLDTWEMDEPISVSSSGDKVVRGEADDERAG
jgi:hypothetical protein